MSKLIFLSVVFTAILLSEINFNCGKVFGTLENGCICTKVQNIIQMQNQISDNGFNPNKKKKC
ncbi:hypothetical protein J6P92_09360 [bacterium]|nr:hypothetical protein [bacterium]